MRHSIYLLLITLILFGFLAGCKTASGSDGDGNDNNGNQGTVEDTIVEVGDNTFQPSELTISSGTTVTFILAGNSRHTVTSGTAANPTGLFDSGDMQGGDQFQYTFSNAGTYEYYCKYHIGMTGTITVQ